MRFALFEPDIPQNAGAILRLAACLGLGVDVIEPLGFVWTDKRVRRAGMDYADDVEVKKHTSWEGFLASRAEPAGRLLLLTTQGATPYTDHQFAIDDVLILGRESAGVPDKVHQAADSRLFIPMVSGMRSLNMATAAALVAGEALRQTNMFPQDIVGEGSHV
jgi:tRNA (cytidine/uridine-2'-O-)-methyltransferase